MACNLKQPGRVWLIGAGPGDPQLITVKAMQCLQAADVVVYDALANRTLLEHVRRDAELIDVGKRARQHKLSQDQINALLVDKARQPARVVRLKGGDPYLFGRGAEELMHLAEQGVAAEVVPGISSGIAAPMYAGIPVTHRELASSVTFITGHEDPDKPGSAIDYAALARLIQAGGTLCVYMGVGRLETIAQALSDAGLDLDTPAGAVQWGTTPSQRSVRATLGTLAQRMRDAAIGAPAILVIGPVAGLDAPGLGFFEARPLFGQRVLITRTRHQASRLGELLADRGARVLEAPTIELHEPTDEAAVERAVRELGGYDWLVLSSANAVQALAERLRGQGLDARHLAGVKVAAIGHATAQTLQRELGIRPDLVPTRHVAESLAGELIAREDLAGRSVLLFRADIARPALPEALGQAGATVTDIAAYETRAAQALPRDVVEALEAGEVDWVTFTSASTVRNLVGLLGGAALLERVRIASIGPITSQAVHDAGLTVTVEAEQAGVEALVEAIERACKV